MINGPLSKVKTARDLRFLNISELLHRKITQEEISYVLELCDALWLYPYHANPTKPHAELTAGDHSDGFVDTLRALRFTNVCQLLAYKLLEKVWQKYSGPIDWVVGSDHAGAAFSHSVAIWLSAQHDFAEKGPDKRQLWKRFTIEPEEVVLQVEELMTTSSTLLAVRNGIREGNQKPVTFAPVVAVLIHRSDVHEIEGSSVISLVHYDIKKWKPEGCPLCKAGSQALRPKQHWPELTGKA